MYISDVNKVIVHVLQDLICAIDTYYYCYVTYFYATAIIYQKKT